MPYTTKDLIKSSIESILNRRDGWGFGVVDRSRERAEYVFNAIKNFLDTDNKRFGLFAEDVTVVLEPDLILETSHVYLEKEGKRLLVQGLYGFLPSYKNPVTRELISGTLRLIRPVISQEALEMLEAFIDESLNEAVNDYWSHICPSSYSEYRDFLSQEDLEQMRKKFKINKDTDFDDNIDDNYEFLDWLYDTESYSHWFKSQWDHEYNIAKSEGIFDKKIEEEMEEPFLSFDCDYFADSYNSPITKFGVYYTEWYIRNGVLKADLYDRTVECSPLVDLTMYVTILLETWNTYGYLYCSFPLLVDNFTELKYFLGKSPSLQFELEVEVVGGSNRKISFGSIIDDNVTYGSFLQALNLGSTSNFSSTKMYFSIFNWGEE